MRYISTRGRTEPVSFKQAVIMGLAPDGGLLLPEKIPAVKDKLDFWRDLEYSELTLAVMQEFIENEIPRETLRKLVSKSYAKFESPEVVTVKELDPLFFAELFLGPTLAFKDIALQLLGNLFEHVLEEADERLNLVGATSGDTGSAAIHGVRGKSNIDIFIMHPDGKVSPIQRQQMTSVLDDNVHNIAIQGNFDDSQRILKELFNDLEFKQAYKLGAVNSVNWARILAQIVYYFYAAFKVQNRTGAEAIQVCVPSGNFGNIFAGYLATQMGAPIKRLILATNENDILARFFTTGVYERSAVHPTLSPSMDIQVASNFERYLYYRLGENSGKVEKQMALFAKGGKLALPGPDPLFVAGSATTDQMLAAIRDNYQRHGYIIDPHSAVGIAVASNNLLDDTPTICLGTAHPAKFPEAVRRALGKDLAHHPRIDAIMDLPTRCTTLPPKSESIKDFIRESS
ncbi:MAG: threonine synthase [Lentisphaeria bacterium]